MRARPCAPGKTRSTAPRWHAWAPPGARRWPHPRRRGAPARAGARGAALAVAVAVAVLMPMQEQLRAPTVPASGVEDPQFYEDLDFYMWLAESEMGSHG